MPGASIKGSAFQAVDLQILRSGVQPGSWYPLDAYRRMLELLVAAAERILLEGFVESLFVPFTNDVITVTSRRPTLDTIVYQGSRP